MTYTFNTGDLIDSTHTLYAGGKYRIKTTATNSIGTSDDSEELIVGLGQKPNKPDAPTFDFVRSNRNQNVLIWSQGVSVDLPVSGYRIYSDNGLPGNRYLVYDGNG